MRNVLVVYRILYGTDYLERSIRSVLAGSDQVFVGYSYEPWTRPKPFTDIAVDSQSRIPFSDIALDFGIAKTSASRAWK